MERVRELLAVDGTRRLFGGVLLDAALVRDLAADLLDAHAALATERERAEAAERALATARADALREAIRECTVVSLELSSDFRLRVGVRAAERCAAAIAALAGCP